MFGFSHNQVYDSELKETVDETWGITPRSALQFIGTDLVRNHIYKLLPDIGDNFWVKCIEYKINNLIKQNKCLKIVIPDVRFENEMFLIKNIYKGMILNVVRNNVINQFSEHISENSINSELFDFYITNNTSISDLYSKIENIIN